EEIRAEAVETDAGDGVGRREVGEQGHDLRHPLVLRGRLAGDAAEDVPRPFQAGFLAPLQQLDVLQGAHALAHASQNVVAEALDPRLDPGDAGGAEEADLFFLEVRLRFVEEPDLHVSARQLGEDALEVAGGEDVVARVDVMAGIARHHRFQLTENAGGRLAAELHRRAVETAERAVRAFAPPASARSLEDEPRLPSAEEAAAPEALQIVLVVWVRQRVEIEDRRRVVEVTGGEFALHLRARADAGEVPG